MQRKYVIALLGACVAGGLAGKLYRDRKNAPAAVELPAPEWTIAQGIEEAGNYMVRNNDDIGHFVYAMAEDGVKVAPAKYNVVRHAGAIYALADLQLLSPSADLRAKAEGTATRAAEHLVSRYVRPVKAQADALAVWSDPREEGGGPRMQAKLGGTGLGLIGLMGRYRALDGGVPAAGAPSEAGPRSGGENEGGALEQGGPTDLSVLRGLGRFIVFMQKPTGDFTSKYTDEGGKSTDFESLYYPGEAMLGITMLYEVDRDPLWLETAAKGIAHLVNSRKDMDPSKLPADHWLMLAIDRFLPYFGDLKSPPITKNEIIGHGVALAKMIIVGQTSTRAARPTIGGCFTKDGRTTPSATRLEGLLALEHVLASDAGTNAETRTEIRTAIVSGIQFLRRAQTKTGPTKGGFPQGVPLPPALEGTEKPKDDSDDERPIDHRGEVRIDYVQHAMSAFMRAHRMCTVDSTGCAPGM